MFWISRKEKERLEEEIAIQNRAISDMYDRIKMIQKSEEELWKEIKKLKKEPMKIKVKPKH